MKKTICLAHIILSLVLLSITLGANAFSAIATIKGQVDKAWYRANNYESQKEADIAALEGCRSEARSNGNSNLANKCQIRLRAKGPGYGAVTCGEGGCVFGTAYNSAQEAVDSVYDDCAEKYKNCKDKDISTWEDFAGFTKKVSTAAPRGNDCRPNTNVLRCQSACTNGNCIVSYENGCKMRVNVSPKYNPFNSQWEYPSPSC